MEIPEIKRRLSLGAVLEHYGLEPNKHHMLHCPFHKDTNPSLQVNLSQGYYKCHGCGSKGDAIQFIQDYEKLTKHEALKKSKSLIEMNPQAHTAPTQKTTTKLTPQERITFLEAMYSKFRKGIYNSIPAKTYCQERNLDPTKLDIGFNGGQFHHGKRKNETLIQNSLEVGLLLDKGLKDGYGIFAKNALVFPLKDQNHQIVSYYYRSIVPNTASKHYYLKNRQGHYPGYPDPATKYLLLTESVIDSASLIQALSEHPYKENTQVLTLYGTNGLGAAHRQTISELKNIEEITYLLDNDAAGKKATEKYAKELYKTHPNIQQSTVELPNKDLNETLQLHDSSIIKELLENRILIPATPVAISSEKTGKPTNVLDYLKAPNLLQRINNTIGQAGIVGEENSRLLLFLITISYTNKSPIHAIVQGSSGSGKTHIISRIADLMPQEDVLRFTRITESSLYNWGEFDLYKKVIIIEDLDGLKEDALYALRELISNQFLSSSVSMKDKKGNNKAIRKEVRGQFSSLSATTKGETYEDNMSRSFLLAVDESVEQTQKIIQYQNRRIAGEIDAHQQQQAVGYMQQIVRKLQHYDIINPYATQLQLPEKVHKIRRLNEMYQTVIKQVTYLNQYQRQTTTDGKLITEIEDIEQATEVLFESIILKVDELDGSLRQFFERLKQYVRKEGEEFILRDIRQAFSMSKTQTFRQAQALLELEYIKPVGGYQNKGIRYKISYWDNYQKIRKEIKEFLEAQIQTLKQHQKPKKQ